MICIARTFGAPLTVPARWLIGPGLLLVGVGLIAMAGLSGGSSWTHLIPGFIVAGLGGGLVNPPLASTAIGVVPPHQADMASGVSSTFRQIGVATGIAALGSIFTAAMQHNLAHAAAVAGAAPPIVALVPQGAVGQLLGSTPAAPPADPPRAADGGHPVRSRGRDQRSAFRHRSPRAGRRGVRAAPDPR